MPGGRSSSSAKTRMPSSKEISEFGLPEMKVEKQQKARPVKMRQVLYSPGTIIQTTAEPFSKTLHNGAKTVVCDECFRIRDMHDVNSLRKCTGCGQMYYCSKECQKKDWKHGHKVECTSQTFRNNFENSLTSETRCQMFRAFAYMKVNPKAADKKYPLFDGTTLSFNDIMARPQGWTPPESTEIICKNMALEIKQEGLDLKGIKVDTQFFMKMAEVFQCHAVVLFGGLECGLQNSQLGSGLYVQMGNVKHSCKPNAALSIRENTLDIRAIAPILIGECPTISFITSHDDKQTRQQQLLERYGIICNCERCETNSDEGVNFKMLQTQIESLARCTNDKQFASSFTQQRLLEKHEQIMQMMRKMYNEYDDRISGQYSRSVAAIINNSKNLSNERVKTLIREARDHLHVSFGSTHPDVLRFEAQFEAYPNLRLLS